MHAKAWITAALVASLWGGALVAEARPAPDQQLAVVITDKPGEQARNAVAAADLHLTCEWMARSYEIPTRVPQELLIAGHSYSDVLIALALVSKGASLNELMELRAYDRWDDIARKVELDPETLPNPIKDLLALGHNDLPARQVLHFLPDVYTGLVRDLTINAFTPVVPSQTLVKRFRLDDEEVKHIRQALDDPFGVPEELLLETAGKGGLKVADWVLAGSLAHHKPFSIDSMLAARSGDGLSWSELCLSFGLRPDVLTRGPLSGIYPILTGSSPGTVLCARKRREFPGHLPLYQDVQNLTASEQAALYPLLLRAYRVNGEEERRLQSESLNMIEKGIAVGLARLARTDLNSILDSHRGGQSWTAIAHARNIDMTGQDGLIWAIQIREHPPTKEG